MVWSDSSGIDLQAIRPKAKSGPWLVSVNKVSQEPGHFNPLSIVCDWFPTEFSTVFVEKTVMTTELKIVAIWSFKKKFATF